MHPGLFIASSPVRQATASSSWRCMGGRRQVNAVLLGCGVTFHFTPPLHELFASRTTRERFLAGAQQPALAALNPLDGLFLLDATPLSLGQVIIVATQDRLNVFLKVFAELAYLFLDALSYFSLRHSVFTYLSREPFIFRHPRRLPPANLRRDNHGAPWNRAFVACLQESHKPRMII
jgi:hypothetical protein